MDSVAQRYKRKKIADNIDFISKLPDDVLLLILSRLSTKEAIRTSVVSKRWEHVWKKLSHLVLNTRRCNNSKLLRLSNDSNPDAELTRVINNHYGHLESCEIIHSTNKKGEHGLLKTWIQTVETRNLTLANMHYRLLCILSHSLPFFQNLSNIKTLKLLSIFAYEIGVFNNVLAFCPSLEVLVLNKIKCIDTWVGRSCLEIKNSKLKLLEIYSIKGIDKVIVSAPNLDILVAKDIIAPEREFLLQSPNLLFNLNSILGGNAMLHIIYNISKEKNNGHEDLVNRIGELRREKYPALSVAVDLMNETEVERLRQVMSLLSDTLRNFCIKFKGKKSPSPSKEIKCWKKKLWVERLPQFRSDRLREFEIKFKGNNALSPSEELESWQKKLWVENDDDDPFPDAKFRVNVVVIYNFKGSKEEIAFISCLIRQRKVKKGQRKMKMRILINSNSISASNRSNIEAAVAKLQEVQSENQKKVTFEYVRN